MKKVISKTIKIKTEKMPPDSDFIEYEIKKREGEPIRWAIVDTDKNILTLSISVEI